MRPRILVVDDDDSIRRMIRTCLELEGFEIIEASNGKEGYEMANSCSPQLLLLDIMMPEMDGLEVCQRLKGEPTTRHLPIIFLSVKGTISDKIAGLESGGDDYISKPFDPLELTARIKAILRRTWELIQKNQMLERMAGKLAKMNLELREQAITDGLTSLFNRRYFYRRLKEEVERDYRYNRCSFSLVIFDIDDFKQINDKYGHLMGDKVLKEIAQLIKNQIRGIDILARYGGEEFTLLLPVTEIHGAQIVGERIRERIENSGIYFLDKLKVTLSGGISSFPLQASTADELIEKADKALYFAKRNGKNKIAVWNSETMAYFC